MQHANMFMVSHYRQLNTNNRADADGCKLASHQMAYSQQACSILPAEFVAAVVALLRCWQLLGPGFQPIPITLMRTTADTSS